MNQPEPVGVHRRPRPATAPRTAERSFPGQIDQIAHARRWLTSLLGPEHAAADDAVLLLSEVFTNSCLHSRSGAPGGRVRVEVAITARHVRVEVTDAGGPRLPRRSDGHDPDAESERGLWLLDMLAKDWDWRLREDGALCVRYLVEAGGCP
ncbi:hypothetical protein GCM10027589_59740 [Actinocorallia lasiicapitis]